MPTSSNFRLVEACLYNYKRNRGKLQQKREELERLKHGASVNAQQYESRDNGGGTAGDPVGLRVARIDELEHDISELERLVNPITRLIHDINESTEDNPTSAYIPMKVILEKRYFGKAINDALTLSEGAYSRARRKLIELAGDYMDVNTGG